MTAKPIAYWASTIFVVLAIASGGIGELLHSWGTLETVTILGYPPYFLTIIGIWKLLGSLALLAPRLPRLKERAYAGIFFNMTGAAASHLFAGNYGAYGYHVIATLCIAGLAMVSWALRPQSRTLGAIFPGRSLLTGATLDATPAGT
jgi:hypothetical protein